MQLPPEGPFALACSFAMFRAAAVVVPERARVGWLTEWQARASSRWEFLRDMGLWNRREAFRLLLFSSLCFASAVRQAAAQESVQQKLRQTIQSPVSCLAVLGGVAAAITMVSGGLPATRDLLFKQYDEGGGKLAYVWLHTMRGGADRPLPSDVVAAWNQHGTLVESAAGFRATRQTLTLADGEQTRTLVIKTEPNFFRVMDIAAAAGSIPSGAGVVVSYEAWLKVFHADPRVLGSAVKIDKRSYPVSAVLQPGARPLTRQPAVYLVLPKLERDDLFAAVRVRRGAALKQVSTELNRMAEDFTYYFLWGQLRIAFAQQAKWTPAWSFGAAALASGLLLAVAFRVKWKLFQQAWAAHTRHSFLRQASFFAGKTLLALACVFTGCLEWSRSSSAILFGNFDPASGPFLLWLYIVGTMGVLFWTVVDQKARCRECLRLLAFPVRIGSPGTVLLDWSGTELCCSEGHGVLHVPHLAPSWSEEAEQWVALDDSWQSLFHDEKRSRH